MKRLLICVMLAACSTPPQKEAQTPVAPRVLDESAPVVKVLRQAERVRDRFRYFSEELKTTYKPDRQRALLTDVQKTVAPACDEMEKILQESADFSGRDQAVAMHKLCQRLNSTLKEKSLEALRPVLKEFNPTMSALQEAAFTQSQPPASP